MSPQPVELKRTEDHHIEIEWSDGFQQRISYRMLRDNCPCATCREPTDTPPATGLRVLSAAETIPLVVQKMQPVGNYAYNIQFSDDHNTGIFTFNLLRNLAKRSS